MTLRWSSRVFQGCKDSCHLSEYYFHKSFLYWKCKDIALFIKCKSDNSGYTVLKKRRFNSDFFVAPLGFFSIESSGGGIEVFQMGNCCNIFSQSLQRSLMIIFDSFLSMVNKSLDKLKIVTVISDYGYAHTLSVLLHNITPC